MLYQLTDAMSDTRWKTESMSTANMAWFVLIAFGLTWAYWIGLMNHWVAVPGGYGTPSVDVVALVKFLPLAVLSPFGPTVAGVLLTYREEGVSGLKRLLGRVADWRMPLIWFLVLLLLQPAYFLVTRLVSAALGVSQPTPIWATDLLAVLPFFVDGVFHGGLTEEIGWRGYALPRLQSRFNAMQSSLILGVVEGLWHAPLIFWASQPQYGMSIWVLLVWQTISTFYRTLVFNNTNGSVFAAILFHAVQNTAGYAVPVSVFVIPWLPDTAYVPALMLLIGVASVALILLVFGSKDMIWRGRQPESHL